MDERRMAFGIWACTGWAGMAASIACMICGPDVIMLASGVVCVFSLACLMRHDAKARERAS